MGTDTSEVFERGPEGLEIAETPDKLVLRKRTYRSMDWGVIMLGLMMGLVVLMMFVISVTKGTLFNYSWWIETLVYGAGFAGIWFCLTRAFNRRVITVTRDRIWSQDGPLPSLAQRLDCPVGKIAEFKVYGSSHMTITLVTYHWYHLDLKTRDGSELPVYRKFLAEKTATLAAARIQKFLNRSGETGASPQT